MLRAIPFSACASGFARLFCNGLFLSAFGLKSCFELLVPYESIGLVERIYDYSGGEAIGHFAPRFKTILLLKMSFFFTVLNENYALL